MKISGIYAIENLVTGKIYIGQATHIKERWKIHKWSLKENRHINTHLQRSWNKYGKQNFQFIILELCSEIELSKKEIFHITEYRKIVGVYNQTDGGEGTKGRIATEKTRQKISESLKGKPSWNKGISHSEETRQKISEATMGRSGGTGMTGKKHSKESCQKMSEVQSGKKKI